MPLDRVEVSRRLKAARALRGVTVAQLAALEQVRVNGITSNLIGETEREDRDARQMELRVIADALGLPAWFFADGDIGEAPAPSGVDSQLGRIENQVAEFQAWAERAVDRIIQDRTAAIARVDLQLQQQREVLDALTETVRRLVRRDDLAPPGELGRVAEGLPPTAQSRPQADRRQAQDSEADTG